MKINLIEYFENTIKKYADKVAVWDCHKKGNDQARTVHARCNPIKAVYLHLEKPNGISFHNLEKPDCRLSPQLSLQQTIQERDNS